MIQADSAVISIPESLIREVCARLAGNKSVRRTLPGHGRLHIERALPFLCVYRRPVDRPDEGTERLVLGEASYLLASGEEGMQADLNTLTESIVKTLADQFGTFLIVEIWSAAEERNLPPGPAAGDPAMFRVMTPLKETLPTTVQVLADALESMELPRQTVAVERKVRCQVVDGGRPAPPGLPPLLTTTEAGLLGCLMIGLEVSPFYRDPESGDPYPSLLRALHREISRALQKGFFDFMHVQTTHRPVRYQVLGRRALARAVLEADRQLAQISQRFNLLLAVTPVNSEAAYAQFVGAKFERAPAFHYRLLPVDPEALKRMLYQISLDRVEDPTLASLLREKRGELDRQINLLEDRETPQFLYASLQLYGAVDEELMRLAEALLAVRPSGGEEDAEEERLDAARFAECAMAEIEWYRNRHRAMAARVEIRDDIPGLMVSGGDLLVGRQTRVACSRLEAALQHEVGTLRVT
jgi:hypothetical protein